MTNPTFLSGGFTAAPELPSASTVVPGSRMLDRNGVEWISTTPFTGWPGSGSWVQALHVTEERAQHWSRVERGFQAMLICSVAFILLGIVLFVLMVQGALSTFAVSIFFAGWPLGLGSLFTLSRIWRFTERLVVAEVPE